MHSCTIPIPSILHNYVQNYLNDKFHRSTMQVQISGCGKTELVTVHTDSTGKGLYRAFQKRRGIHNNRHILTHGVSVIRTGLSIRDQGIRHLSTLFVLSVTGNGGGITRLGMVKKRRWRGRGRG